MRRACSPRSMATGTRTAATAGASSRISPPGEPARRRPPPSRSSRRWRRPRRRTRRRSATGSTPSPCPTAVADGAAAWHRAGSAPWWGPPTRMSRRFRSRRWPRRRPSASRQATPAVTEHPWLERATRYCLDAIEAMDEAPFAYVLAFSIRFLDAVYETYPGRPASSRSSAATSRPDGRIPRAGWHRGRGASPARHRPYPDRPARGCSPTTSSRPTSLASRASSRTTGAGPSTTSRSRRRARSAGAATQPSGRSTSSATAGSP